MSDTGLMIHPYKKGACKMVERDDSEYDRVYHKSIPISGFVVPYDENTDCYLTYYRNPATIEEVLTEHIRESLPYVQFKTMEGFGLRDGIELTELQIELYNKVFCGKTKKYMPSRWYLNLDTGRGKTLLALYIASKLRYKTMVVCGFRKVLDQWKNTLVNKFTINPERIMNIDSGKFIDAILTGDHDTTEENIFIVNSSLISSYGNRKGWKYIGDLMKKLGIGCLIIDEAHRAFGNTIRMTACANIRFVQYLSADFGQGQYSKEQRFMNAFAGVPVIRPDKQVRDDLKYTVGIVVKFNSGPTASESQFAIYNKYGYDADRYLHYQMSKPVFKDAIMWALEYINKVNKNRYQTLILFTNIWAVDAMCDYLRDNPVMQDKVIARFHGQIPDVEKDAYIDADVIVATYASFSTGIDINTIKYVIGTNQSNKVEDNQAAGRAGRIFNVGDDREVFYMMLVDEGFAYCKRKLPTRISYLKEMKFKSVVQVKYYHETGYDVDDPGI